jgi:hypothetical protein
VGELAVGAVDLAPLGGQPQDLLDLLVQQALDHPAAGGPVRQCAGGAPGLPTVDPPLADLQHPAGSLGGEPLGDGLVDQLQQRLLGGGFHPWGTPPINPSAMFPAARSARSPAP